jgi:hypothetical protein
MRELYDLKEKIFHELKEYSKRDLTAGSLENIKNLAKTAYYLCDIIASDGDSGYSNRYDYPRRGNSREMRPDYNYRPYPMRNNNDGYSYHGSDMEYLREMMEKAPNDEIRQHYQSIINSMGNMQ